MTLARVTDVQRWILPARGARVRRCSGIGRGRRLAGVGRTDHELGRRLAHRHASTSCFRDLSFFGSTKVVILVSAIAALLAATRCPRLALAIVVIALARPATEFLLKELVSRDRPIGDRLVGGEGYSFPSGHPLATVASWGTLPLVAALYTKRRVVWWAIAVAVWTMVVLVAMSRVWLGVHWASDVIASLALGVIGVAVAERFVVRRRSASAPAGQRGSGDGTHADDVGAEAVDRPVLETTS